MKKESCAHCASTGLLSATLVKTEEGRHIAVVVCGGHYNNEAAEKTMTGMHVASGLNVEVLRVEKPTDKNHGN